MLIGCFCYFCGALWGIYNPQWGSFAFAIFPMRFLPPAPRRRAENEYKTLHKCKMPGRKHGGVPGSLLGAFAFYPVEYRVEYWVGILIGDLTQYSSLLPSILPGGQNPGGITRFMLSGAVQFLPPCQSAQCRSCAQRSPVPADGRKL